MSFKGEQHRDQTLSNIEGDPRLTDDEKIAARALANEQFGKFANGEEDTPATWDSACKHRLEGLERAAALLVPLEAGERLGSVVRRGSFEREIVAQTRRSAVEAARLVELAINANSRPLTRDEQLDLAELRSRVRLRRDAVWLFQNEGSPAEPFEGIDFGLVPCSLGLPYRLGEEVIGVEVAYERVPDAHRPCVYDPGWHFQEFWRPSGRTRPSCGNHQPERGFLEWVASAPLLAEAHERLTLGTVADCLAPGETAYDV